MKRKGKIRKVAKLEGKIVILIKNGEDDFKMRET
jgi:hypothetical protein